MLHAETPLPRALNDLWKIEVVERIADAVSVFPAVVDCTKRGHQMVITFS